LPQKRSLALASILQSLAAVEIVNALHLRDFRSLAIFEFFNTIRHKQTISVGISQQPKPDIHTQTKTARSASFARMQRSFGCSGFQASHEGEVRPIASSSSKTIRRLRPEAPRAWSRRFIIFGGRKR
jgi:hypothetical protein